MQKYVLRRVGLLAISLAMMPTTGFAMRSIVSAVRGLFSSSSSTSIPGMPHFTGIKPILGFRSKALISSEKAQVADQALMALVSACPDTWRLVLAYMQAQKTNFKLTQDDLVAVEPGNITSPEHDVHSVMRFACPKIFWGLHKPKLSSYYQLPGNADVIKFEVLCCQRGTTHDDGAELTFTVTKDGKVYPSRGYASCWLFNYSDTVDAYDPHNELALGWQEIPVKGYLYTNKRGCLEYTKGADGKYVVTDSGLACDVSITDYDPVMRGGRTIEGCFYDRADHETVSAIDQAVERRVAGASSAAPVTMRLPAKKVLENSSSSSSTSH